MYMPYGKVYYKGMANTITLTFDYDADGVNTRVARLIATPESDDFSCEHCDEMITDPYCIELAFDDSFAYSIFVHVNHIIPPGSNLRITSVVDS